MTLDHQPDAALGARIEALLRKRDAHVSVHNVRRVFGGNARKAWAFELRSASYERPCILLSQVPGRHVDSDSAAEFGMLSALNGKNVRAPAAIALDASGEITGAPAIILERVEGVATATALLNPQGDTDLVSIIRDLAKAAADLHAVDWRAAGIAAPNSNATRSQIDFWEARFLKDRMAPYPALSFLFDWLKKNVPPPSKLSLVHGDLRIGNFLFKPDRITAILDWEMAHIGDPMEDIAWIYRDLWGPGKFVSLDEFIDLYQARAGYAVERLRIDYFRIFSEVKFATISLSASNAFFRGGARNLRYADRAAKTPACVAQSLAMIKSRDWSRYYVAG